MGGIGDYVVTLVGISLAAGAIIGITFWELIPWLFEHITWS